MDRFPLAVVATVLLASAPASAQDSTAPTELETLVAGESGLVVVGYQVNAAGRAEKCVVEQSSGFARLDAASCDMMLQYGRFAPKPARATRAIHWVLPQIRVEAPRPVPRSVAARKRMNPGTASDWASVNPDWGKAPGATD